LWLDEERVYSCAYFTSADESLDQAQRNKQEHICRKLRPQPGERLLDIGCGALEFEAGSTGIYQILASRRNRGEWPVPLSRRDLYAGRDNGQFAGVN